MKVLIADKLSPNTVTALKNLGLDVQVQADLTAESLPGAMQDVDILVVRSTKVSSQTIMAAPKLSLIIRAGAGVNTIDVATASGRGIYVANCPGMNNAAVAELAIGLLIAADRRIVEASLALRDGKWRKGEFGKSAGLKGRTLGLLGFGAIGKAVAQAALGLDMKVRAWWRSLTPELAESYGIECASSAMEIASRSDAVSVHLPYSPQTKHIVGAEFLEAMRPGAILVNTSRGELVDTDALLAAIDRKQLRVGVDVFEEEPAGNEAPFEQTALAAAVTGTPHIGASTEQASEAIAADVVRIAREFLETGHPAGVVNLAQKTPATHYLVVRHLNRVGVLASILDGLRNEKINVEEMNNSIFAGGEAACCTLELAGAPSAALVAELRASADILQVVLNSHSA